MLKSLVKVRKARLLQELHLPLLMLAQIHLSQVALVQFHTNTNTQNTQLHTRTNTQ